jgi:hypothetical protein
MPKGLVFGALALLAVVVIALTWMSNRSMEGDGTAPVAENAPAPAPTPAAAIEPAAPTGGNAAAPATLE